MLDNILKDKSQLFKTITIVISVIIGLVAILIFSGKFPGVENTAKKNTNQVVLEVWGSLPDKTFRDALTAYQTEGNDPVSITYLSYSKDTLTKKLIEASSQGVAPDLVLAPYSELLSVSGLLQIIPYNYMTELEYKNIFVDGTHILATPFGASFYPVLIDPNIMIFNKKILSENGFSNAPAFWTDFPKYQDKLTTYDSNNKPEQSAFAIAANNVLNKDLILYTQLLQLDSNPARPIWGRGENNTISLDYNLNIGLSGANYSDVTSNLYKILKFQTAFSDPQKTSFTWSETDKLDIEKFISGKLAIYFGKASDIDYIKSSNPNLDLGLYFMPQMQDAKFQSVSGEMLGVAVTKSAKDVPYAVNMAQIIAGKTFSRQLSLFTGMAGARKDVLYGADGSERSEVVGRSSLAMKLIYNNNPTAIKNSIYKLYDNVLSGRRTLQEATEIFGKEWDHIYGKNKEI